MARSRIGGLLARGVESRRITVADPITAQLQTLEAQYGIRVTTDNAGAASDAEVVVLAVKPQDMQKVTMLR